MLVDDRKGSVLFFARWLFHGARFSRYQTRKMVAEAALQPQLCRLPTTTPGRGAVEGDLGRPGSAP